MMKFVLFLLIATLSPLYAAVAVDSPPLPAAWVSCTQDSDCVEVGAGCNGCCHSTAVNNTSRQLYNEALKKQCEGYNGPVCECAPGGIPSVACKQNSCTYSVCPYNSNGPWFHSRITLEKKDLPEGLALQNVELPEYSFEEITSSAGPVYILGPPQEWQQNMKAEFDVYKEHDLDRLEKHMLSPQHFDENMQSYDERMAIYDLGTPWEKQYGLVKRIKIEGGQLFQFLEHSTNPGEKWSGWGKSPDAEFFPKNIPGLITTSGVNRPQDAHVPTSSEFNLPILWKDKVYWIHGKTSYSLSKVYTSCK